MKKLLLSLGSVAAIVAPVAAVVACGSDTPANTNTEWQTPADQWGVKTATELKNLLGTELKVTTLTDADATSIFTQIGGVDGTELLLNVFTKTAGKFAIVVEGTSLIEDGSKPQTIAPKQKELETKYGITNAELAKGSYVITIDATGASAKVEVQDVVVSEDDFTNALGLLA